jgi:hypothetical protein
MLKDIYHAVFGHGGDFAGGTYKVTDRGVFAVNRTAGGDGTFTDIHNKKLRYMVDSGNIAIVSASLTDPAKASHEYDFKIVSTSAVKYTFYNDGRFQVSYADAKHRRRHISINTAYDEEEDDEEEEEDDE